MWHHCHRSWVAGSKVQWSDAKVNNKHLSALLKGILKDFSSLCDQTITSSLHVNVANKKKKKKSSTNAALNDGEQRGQEVARWSQHSKIFVWVRYCPTCFCCCLFNVSREKQQKQDGTERVLSPNSDTFVVEEPSYPWDARNNQTSEKVSATHSPSGNTITSKLRQLYFNSGKSLNQVKSTQSSIWEKDD